MAQVSKPTAVYKVVLTEYERGWGQKPWDVLYFDNEQEAMDYATNYNQTHNNEPVVPDWYVLATYGGLVR